MTPTKIKPLIDPGLAIGRRTEAALILVQQLCEQLLLGGTLKAWQVAGLLRGLTAQWEAYGRSDAEARRWAAYRTEREHWACCEKCGHLLPALPKLPANDPATGDPEPKQVADGD